MIKLFFILLSVYFSLGQLFYLNIGEGTHYPDSEKFIISSACEMLYSKDNPHQYNLNRTYIRYNTFFARKKLPVPKLCTYTALKNGKADYEQKDLDILTYFEEIKRGITEIPICKEIRAIDHQKYKCLTDDIKQIINLKPIFEDNIKQIKQLKHLFEDDLHVKYNCSKNISCRKFNHLQKCVLQTAKYRFLEKYIELYLDEHPEIINYQNEDGWTALMLAARNSNHTSTDETVEILLKYNADVNLQNNDEFTALILASGKFQTDSSEKTIELLLEYNADVNVQDLNGNTALMYASFDTQSKRSSKIVSLLLDHHADVNIHNKNYDTALTIAVKNTKVYELEHIEMLIEKMTDELIERENEKIINYVLRKYGFLIEQESENIEINSTNINHEIVDNERDLVFTNSTLSVKINPNINNLVTILMLVYIFLFFYCFIKIFLWRIRN